MEPSTLALGTKDQLARAGGERMTFIPTIIAPLEPPSSPWENRLAIVNINKVFKHILYSK
jgi:hypothetical protein